MIDYNVKALNGFDSLTIQRFGVPAAPAKSLRQTVLHEVTTVFQSVQNIISPTV